MSLAARVPNADRGILSNRFSSGTEENWNGGAEKAMLLLLLNLGGLDVHGWDDGTRVASGEKEVNHNN
jgi:hypothetical protein